jgi:hypothetical protein
VWRRLFQAGKHTMLTTATMNGAVTDRSAHSLKINRR